MNIRPLTAAFGAEVTDVDLASDPARSIDALRETLLERSLLVIRDQHLTERQFADVGRGFGPIEAYESTVKEFLLPGFPDIIVVSNVMENGKPVGIREAGQYWHTDRSYVKDPAWSSLLYAIRLPVDAQGVTHGDTQFASTTTALAALDPALRERLRGREAIHRYVYRYTKEPENPLPPVSQPIVLRHPYTGRESLYVNKGFTFGVVGMPDEEGRTLLDELFAHIADPRFVYTHRWRLGDIVMWDNFATQHNAVADYQLPLERMMWRTTVRHPANAALGSYSVTAS